MKDSIDLAVIGGGAAGFFAAINYATLHPEHRVSIFEKGSQVLAKVKISGGGRCNVTHACFDQKELTGYYPRGQKELLGPFHQFMTFDTISWFADRGVELKTEDDGRMFPVTNSSQTIIDCFLKEIKKLTIDLQLHRGLSNFEKNASGFELTFSEEKITTKKLLISTGSSNLIWEMLASKGIKIVDPVPSLFTFNYKNKTYNDLMGTSVKNVGIKIEGTKFESNGPILFTHWGFSGPAILKLSAWAARELHDKNYQFNINIDFSGYDDEEKVYEELIRLKEDASTRQLKTVPLPYLPKRLWELFCDQISAGEKQLANCSAKELKDLCRLISHHTIPVNGKSTFKDEFVTCGGVDLSEINMKTMESKKIPGLYFAGECLNIDAITGGFNFQSAWTTGFIAANAMV